MNRMERRRVIRRTVKPEAKYMVTESQLENMIMTRIRKMMPEITEQALLTMVYNSILVIEGHFGELMKKDTRVQKYVDLLQFQMECFGDRAVTGEDMRRYLKETYDLEVKLT